MHHDSDWQFIGDTWSAFPDLTGKSLRVRFLFRVFQKDLSLSDGPLSSAQDKQAHSLRLVFNSARKFIFKQIL